MKLGYLLLSLNFNEYGNVAERNVRKLIIKQIENFKEIKEIKKERIVEGKNDFFVFSSKFFRDFRFHLSLWIKRAVVWISCKI
jgi:hypothetical protein